ncbi:MAG: LacI family transcriptional regulator [Firmicutes bacterium]|nr:LacI family transcriptional regulator [Bacillota bacterium]
MATIKDLSEITGLGIGTISRYLNGYNVKEKTKDKIETAIAQTGYVRNSVARSMKTGKSMMVAVIVPHLANMFSMRVIESIERVLERHGYSVIISDCGGSAENQLNKLELMKQRMVDGFVLLPLAVSGKRLMQAASGKPLVLIDRLLDVNLFDSVTVNNFEVSYRETKQLLLQGVRRIGIIAGPHDVYTAVERKKGFEKALDEFGIADAYIETGGYNVEDGFKAMKRLLNRSLEGLFISNYELTIGALQAYAQSSQTIKIIGFDSIELSSLINRTITCISQPIEQIGEKAAELLLNRMKDPSRRVENVVINI